MNELISKKEYETATIKEISEKDLKWVLKEINNDIIVNKGAKYQIVRVLVLNETLIKVQKEDNSICTIYKLNKGILTLQNKTDLKNITKKQEIEYKEIETENI